MSNNTVPKSIRRIREEYGGFPIQYIILLIVLAGFTIFLFIGILASGDLGKAVLMALIFVIWFVFYKHFRSPTMMEKSWLAYQYFIRSLSGQNLIAKYAINTSDEYLSTIVPIKAIHDGGLVEFIQNRFGLFVKVEPSRVADDDLDSHIQKTRNLVDSLHGELLMKVFVCSMSMDNYRPLEENLINSMNEEGKTEKQKKHLFEIYKESNSNTSSVIQWNFYVFIGIGTHKKLDDAKIAREQYYPGFETKLIKAGMKVIEVTDKKEVARIYRQCINPFNVYNYNGKLNK